VIRSARRLNPGRFAPFLLAGALCLGAGLRPGLARAQVELAAPRPNSDELTRLKHVAEAAPKDPHAWGEYGRALMARDDLEDRLRASKVLRHAVALAPRDVDLRLALADLYFRQGYFTLSRRQLQAALRNDKDSAPAYSRLGRLAFRDWRKYQRRGSLEAARKYWQDAARRAPTDSDPWLGLGVLALLDRDARGVLAAGRQVLASGRELPRQTQAEALLLVGAGAYGLGWPQIADSAFGLALPRLPARARDLLSDITPAASDADTAAYHAILDSGQREQFLATFWKSRDPDLTTPYNEVRLEFLSRGTVAYFLYYDARRRAWDERGSYLVRYGLPDSVEYNPPPITGEWGSLGASGMNRLFWYYGSLGFAVYLEDRLLNEFYDLPMSTSNEVDYVPDPADLAAREAEGAATTAGRGVFRTILPGQSRLMGAARIGQFRRVEGFDPRASAAPASAAAAPFGGFASGGQPVARVEAWLAVTGRDAPRDLWGEAVVYRDSSFVEVARARSGFPAICQSDSVGILQFNFDLPAGQYVVGLSARDSIREAAGSWRVPVSVSSPAAGRLEVSDLELACGLDQGRRNTPFAKTDYAVYPNPLGRAPRDQPFGFYFEVYNLVSDAAGKGQLSIEYQIHSTRKDGRPFFIKAVNPRKNDPVVNVSKVDDVPGRARFQYVSANLADQRPGPYRVDVTVTDLTSTMVAKKSLDFELVE